MKEFMEEHSVARVGRRRIKYYCEIKEYFYCVFLLLSVFLPHVYFYYYHAGKCNCILCGKIKEKILKKLGGILISYEIN